MAVYVLAHTGCVSSDVYMMSVQLFIYFLFFFKQKTAYEMRISDWSSDVCSSDLSQPRSVPLVPCVPSEKPVRETSKHESAATPANENEQIGRASCRERVCQ